MQSVVAFTRCNLEEIPPISVPSGGEEVTAHECSLLPNPPQLALSGPSKGCLYLFSSTLCAKPLQNKHNVYGMLTHSQ